MSLILFNQVKKKFYQKIDKKRHKTIPKWKACYSQKFTNCRLDLCFFCINVPSTFKDAK